MTSKMEKQLSAKWLAWFLYCKINIKKNDRAQTTGSMTSSSTDHFSLKYIRYFAQQECFGCQSTILALFFISTPFANVYCALHRALLYDVKFSSHHYFELKFGSFSYILIDLSIFLVFFAPRFFFEKFLMLL